MALYSHTFNRPHGGARCGRCKRRLTDPVSISLGMGPECRGHAGRSMSGSLCKRDEFSDQFDSSVPFEQALVLKRAPRPVMHDSLAEVGQAVTNVPHLVVHHSPDGFEFGYSGSGPTDLALNICQLYLNLTGYEGQQTKLYDGKCWSLAYAIRIDFRNHFIASAPRKGKVIPFADIDAWFKSVITSQLLDQYSLNNKE
jgi:hypothetical protein